MLYYWMDRQSLSLSFLLLSLLDLLAINVLLVGGRCFHHGKRACMHVVCIIICGPRMWWREVVRACVRPCVPPSVLSDDARTSRYPVHYGTVASFGDWQAGPHCPYHHQCVDDDNNIIPYRYHPVTRQDPGSVAMALSPRRETTSLYHT